ncbi:hypothetical protein NBRC10512_004287 [Rhodotorula toruloides]|uniref:RHTO0S02e06238g1_1 n=2 Tax=Rhodotorula toruloides TaxID=5286 RepID=A0A061AHY2_RHOTO|nr:transposon tx1 uncharacterized 149 kda [Rhodotorula toruloides NP11]EMS21882.1 transposon tx1 uncharacterized 149 kda [Rhodotorula toruloides NP11]CDR36739.1 RHTO0S02e06238g1_1 [Rhodotorula toruloides]
MHGKVVSWSRIDHILVDERLASSLRDAFVRYDAPASDHRPVFALLTLHAPIDSLATLPSTSTSISRLPPALFSDPTFSSALSLHLNLSVLPRLSTLSPSARWEAKKKEIVSFAGQHARRRAAERRQVRFEAEGVLQSLEAKGSLSPQEQLDYATSQGRLTALEDDRKRTLSLRAHLPLVDGVAAETRALETRLQSRQTASTFPSVQLDDGSSTLDIDSALGQVDRHFARIFSSDAFDLQVVQQAQDVLLAPVRQSRSDSDPRLGRRWPEGQAARLGDAITVDEVRAAILSAPHSSSPGPSGLPYEFYQQNIDLLAQDLADAFNCVWDDGALPPSLSLAYVRLLIKRKPGLDPAAFASYRPISLRDADYRILGRVLVKRLNPLLPLAIPLSQVGFVPGRRSADAGRHLQLLVDELARLDLPKAVLLSLDQEKAYDRVSHDWIFATYEAFGAPARFIRLLRTIYDGSSLRARYNINGFLSPGVRLRTGLPQGDPLSCASWILTFQPFLDALLLRQVALTLPRPLSPSISTTLAFADDAILACGAIMDALPRLEALAQDWRLASNGRLNTSKTEVLAIGSLARHDPDVPLNIKASLKYMGNEGFATWAGFAIAPGGPPDSYYALLLNKIQRRTQAASGCYASLRTRAVYANTHLLSPSLHSLAYWPAPPSFLNSLASLLLDFVWGGASHHHAVKKDTVFLPVAQGGLGLLNPLDLDCANSLAFLDSIYTATPSLYLDLALASRDRTLSPRQPDSSSPSSSSSAWTPWTVFRTSKTSTKNRLWSRTLAALRSSPFVVSLYRLGPAPTASLLSLPPSLFCSAGSLTKIRTIAQLYDHHRVSNNCPPGLYTRYLPTSPPRFSSGLLAARHDWLLFVAAHPLLRYYLPLADLAGFPAPLPTPQDPPPTAFSFLGLPHGFSASAARRALVARRSVVTPHARLEPHIPQAIPEATTTRLWRWLRRRPATPREADTHWRILQGAVTTRRRQFKMGLAPDDRCVFCGLSESLTHALFDCAFSSSYWTALVFLLAHNISDYMKTTTLAPDELLLGLPTLTAVTDASSLPLLRAIVAVGLQTLVDARWARIRPTNPTQTSPSAGTLASRAFSAIAVRLE